MGKPLIEGVWVTPQKIIKVPGGNVLHAMKCIDPGFAGFGEAYFSTVKYGSIKGWKKHFEMTLNLIVPRGSIRFVMFDDRAQSPSHGEYMEIELSQKNYQRLTVPPNIWMAFMGMAKQSSILLNIANIPHSPDEVDRKNIHEIAYNWELEK